MENFSLRSKNVVFLFRHSHVFSLSVSVLRSHWRRGVATAVLTSLLEAAKVKGAVKAGLKVNAHNEAAVGLYTRLGFVTEGVLRREVTLDGEYRDCLVMAKFLDEDA